MPYTTLSRINESSDHTQPTYTSASSPYSIIHSFNFPPPTKSSKQPRVNSGSVPLPTLNLYKWIFATAFSQNRLSDLRRFFFNELAPSINLPDDPHKSNHKDKPLAFLCKNFAGEFFRNCYFRPGTT